MPESRPVVVLVGSTRQAKVAGAREAVHAIASVDPRFLHAVLTPRDLGDAGPRMPMSEAAIIEGARIRAAALLADGGGGSAAQYAVGLEGGLDRVAAGDGAWALKTWACVTDGRRWSYGAGGVVLVPDAIADAVLAGRELGEVVDAGAGAGVRGTRGAWGVLTRDLISRQDAFRIAVVSAFAPFYNPAVYA